MPLPLKTVWVGNTINASHIFLEYQNFKRSADTFCSDKFNFTVNIMPLTIISSCFNFMIHRNGTVIGTQHLQIPLQNGGRGGITSKWQLMVDKPHTINCTSNQIIQPDYTTLHCLLFSFKFIKRILKHVITCTCIWKFFFNQMSSGTRIHLGNKVSEECWCCKSLAWRQAGCKECGQWKLHNGKRDAA